MVPFVTPIPFWQHAAWTPPRTWPNPGAPLRVRATKPLQVCLHLHIRQHRETRIEEPFVAQRRLTALRFRHPHSGPVEDLLADQQASVQRRGAS